MQIFLAVFIFTLWVISINATEPQSKLNLLLNYIIITDQKNYFIDKNFFFVKLLITFFFSLKQIFIIYIKFL